MISHYEAEVLISARLDQQLDPLTERELAAHLATCQQCRAFARSTSALATGLRDLPYLPPSPTVSRGVMARVEEGRSPWLNFGGFLSNPGPAFSTLAIIAVVLLLGFFVLNRFVLDGRTPPDQGNQQLASQPTVPPETPRTFTVPGTPEPTASATSEPTATMMPTETPAPTETQAPVPTETTAPVPTATTPPEPTATTPPEPTATNAPMIANTAATSQPVDLTGEEEHATPQPTATPEPSPTATATVEPSPTESPAPEPTSTPEDSGEAPPIVPVDGANVIEAPEDVEATATSEAESTQEATPDETDTTIQPISTSDGTGGGSDTPQRIEPIGGTSPESTSASEETPESTEAPATETSTDENAIDLDANSEAYGGIAGDPSGRLVLDDGRMEYQPQAHPAILTSGDGLKAETEATSDGQAVVLCSGDECADVSSESADGPSTDTPLSWINGALIYVRDSGGRISYHALVPNDAGTAAASDTVLYDGGADLGPTFPVYRADNQVWVITQGSGWLALTDGTAHLYGDDFGSPRLLRFAATGEGSIVAYVADGKVIVATTDAPGSPIGSAPFNGVDFDVSPGGSRIVVSTGSAIEIYDLDGNLISTYASPDMQPGTVLWLNSGVVFQNEATGTLMQIPDPES